MHPTLKKVLLLVAIVFGTLILDRKTGGKISGLLAKIPVLGNLAA